MHLYYQYTDPQMHLHHAVDLHPTDESFPLHVHDSYEILYFVSGYADYLVEGSAYPLQPGSLVIMRPSESHKVKILGDRAYERYSVSFDSALLAVADPERRLLAPFRDHPLGQHNFYPPEAFLQDEPGELFKAMCEPAEEEAERRLRILTYLYPLLGSIRRAFLTRYGTESAAPPHAAAPAPAEEILSYINQHLFEELSLERLSGHFFLSTSQIGRLFRRATGSSVWEYVTIKRLLAARRRLRKGEAPSAVCSACGFRDYSAFFRAYVKRFGISPQKEAPGRSAGETPK